MTSQCGPRRPNLNETKMRRRYDVAYRVGPLYELINKSFQSGIFPDIFKIAKVTPIFKSESRVRCSNYRPISLLSNMQINRKVNAQTNIQLFRTTKLVL